jgi:hypothetical protein
MSSANARAGEREWKPKMKNRGRKAPASASVSSQAADRAMANIKDLNRRRDRGEDVDAAYLTKVSRSLEAPAKEGDVAAKASQSPGKISQSSLLAGVLGLAAILLVIGGVRAFGSARYSVAGTVRLDERPLAGVELLFHPSTTQGSTSRTTTAADGAFSLGGLPAGTYKVTLGGGDDSAASIPPSYKRPESTPFRLKIRKDLDNVSLYAVHPKRR